MALGACAHYTPRPLTAAAVQKALAPRPVSRLWVRRSRLLLPALPALRVHRGQALTPDLAAVVAVVADPALRALRARQAVAQAQVLAAGLLPNPTFSYGVGVPMSGVGLVKAFRVALGLPIRALMTRAARQRVARLHAQAVDLTVAWQEWQVAAQAKALVYAIEAGRAERQLLGREVRLLRRSVAMLADGEAAGYVTAGVTASARMALHQTQVLALTVARHVAAQSLALHGLLGLRGKVPLHLAAAARHRTFTRCLSQRFWQQGVSHRRLDLLALRRGYRSQDAALRLAIADQFPRLTLGLNRARDTSDINTLGAGIGISLPIFNHNQGAIAIARASRAALLQAYAARLFTARAQIQGLLTRLANLRRTRAATAAAVRSLARLHTIYRVALAHHRIPALTYYRLLERLTHERLAQLKDRALLDQTAVALEAASGRFTWPIAGCKGSA